MVVRGPYAGIYYVGRAWSFGTSLRRVGCALIRSLALQPNQLSRTDGGLGYIWRARRADVPFASTGDSAHQGDVNAQYLGAETMSTMRINLKNRIYLRGSVGYAEDKVQRLYPARQWNMARSVYWRKDGRRFSTERRNPYGSLTYHLTMPFSVVTQTLNFQLGSAFSAHLR